MESRRRTAFALCLLGAGPTAPQERTRRMYTFQGATHLTRKAAQEWLGALIEAMPLAA